MIGQERSALEARSNRALIVNPTSFGGVVPDEAITVHGSDWYWAVFAVMLFSTIVFMGLAFTKPRSARIFHYITAAITGIATIAYFTMASNLGWVPIDNEFIRNKKVVRGRNREIFYVRYVDWALTTPLLLLDLLLTAGVPWPTILSTILFDEAMIVTGLIGALVASSYKWGYYVFGNLAFFGVIWNLATARKSANFLGADVHKAFLFTGVWTLALWFFYPIAWGLCEGGNVISSDSEAVFYGILDIFAKPGFGALLLFFHRGIEPSRLGLHIKDYDSGHSVTGTHHEKTTGGTTGTHGGITGTHGGTTGVHNGTHTTETTTAAV